MNKIKKEPKTHARAHGAIRSPFVETWDGDYKIIRIPSGSVGDEGSCLRADDLRVWAEYLLKCADYLGV